MRFQRFMSWLQPHAGDAQWLEKFASILFLAKRETNPTTALTRLRAKLLAISIAEFDQLWNQARNLIAENGDPVPTAQR